MILFKNKNSRAGVPCFAGFQEAGEASLLIKNQPVEA
jgi:hypothetical protein